MQLQINVIYADVTFIEFYFHGGYKPPLISGKREQREQGQPSQTGNQSLGSPLSSHIEPQAMPSLVIIDLCSGLLIP